VEIFERMFPTTTVWCLDVWDCHGVLKMREWGVGCGCKPELPENLMWLDIGFFTIPIPKNEQNLWDERLKNKVDKLLMRILTDNGGAINWSGIYPVYLDQMQRIITAVVKYHKPQPKRVSLATLF